MTKRHSAFKFKKPLEPVIAQNMSTYLQYRILAEYSKHFPMRSDAAELYGVTITIIGNQIEIILEV